jgi:ABC-type glycerol-3-phosphate transport system substrate-binding protein
VTEAVAIGQSPDVVLADPEQYFLWSQAGAVVDLEPYVQHPSYGMSLDDLYPAMAARDVVSRTRLAFPGLMIGRVLLYNLSWAETLGFDSPPSSTDSFLQQACAAHQSNGDRTGGWMISSAAAPAWLLAFQETPGQMLDFKSAAVEETYNFLLDLNGQGCAWQPSEPYPDQAFVDRLGLFYSVSTREIGYVAEAFDASSSRDEWASIGYPNAGGESSVSLYGSSYIVLRSDLESQVAGWLFVRYMAGEKVQVHLAETALFLPLDRNTAARLSENSALPAAWQDSLALLDSLVIEPQHPQWHLIRAVLGEAQTEVLDERFAPGTLSLFLDRFDKLSKELTQPAATPAP